MTALEDTLLVNPDQCVRQSFALSIIRAEGIVLVLAGMIRGTVIFRIAWVTGIFGALFFIHPRSYEQIANSLLYENAEDVEWNTSTPHIVRIIGIVYVLVAIMSRSPTAERNQLTTRIVAEIRKPVVLIVQAGTKHGSQ